MKAYEITSRLLSEYGQAANGTPIELDSKGVAVIEVKRDVHITLYLGQYADSLIFLAEVIPLTLYSKDDALIRSLLSHAFPGYRTRGGALLINETDNTLVYSYEKKLNELNPVRLESIIGNFSETVLYFRAKAAEVRRNND